MLEIVTTETFAKEVEQEKGPVLLFLTTTDPDAAACHMMKPVVWAIGDERKDTIKTVYVNANDEWEIPMKLGVDVMPMYILFKDGKPVSAQIGLCLKRHMDAWLDEALTRDPETAGRLPEEGPYAAWIAYGNQNPTIRMHTLMSEAFERLQPYADEVTSEFEKAHQQQGINTPGLDIMAKDFLRQQQLRAEAEMMMRTQLSVAPRPPSP